MTADFWRGKRVFVTGHTGFKGSWLSLWLQSMGVEVTGYALTPPTNPSLFEVANVAQGMTSIIADIRDLPTLQKAMQAAQPDIVIHMAAQPLVRYSYVEPVETYSTNVMGTIYFMEAVRRTRGVKAVVIITSDKCYENKEWVWGYREIEPMGGYDPYSNSKGCAELVTAAYRSSFFNPSRYAEHGVAVASARAGNVIGGGDWAADRLIPDIVRAIERNESVDIRNPYAIRPWQHVLEPLSGYLALAENLYVKGTAYAEGWNFGPDDESAQSVETIARTFAGLCGDLVRLHVDSSGSHPHEASYLKLDCSKAKTKLKWHPCWDLKTALEATAAWYKAHQAGQDMKGFTLEQVRAYIESAGL